MSVINTQPLAGASGSQATGYNLTKSLRFRGSANAYLSRTPSATATSNQKFTISFWAKISLKTTNNGESWLFDCYNQNFGLFFDSNSKIALQLSTGVGYYYPTQVFRDPAAWYHFVIAVDTTQATGSNRIRYYVNGVEITSWTTQNIPAQNTTYNWNQSGNAQYIGTNSNATNRSFDGNLAEFYSIDGQQLTPSSFGENNADTGVWQPKRYTGTYGTNGFYLPFTDVATTSGSNAGLGKDFSGNGNYWNTNNISVTSGSTYDSMTDVPTLTSATVANYCVLNPLDKDANITYFNANSAAQGYNAGGAATFQPTAGKFYWEVKLIDPYGSGTYGSHGLSIGRSGSYVAAYTGYTGAGIYIGDGSDAGTYENGTKITAYNTFAANDIISFAYDATNLTLDVYRNNTKIGSTLTVPSTARVISIYQNGTSGDQSQTYYNFGQQPFTYTPPTGYVALNTYNLPTSTIVKGNTVMDATLYTGNGSTQSITNTAGFKPDFVWIKGRSTAWAHRLADSVRGVGKELFSNDTSAETTNNSGGYLTSFNSNGFSINSGAGVNTNNDTYVGWQWQAGQGTTSSNTNGSITSTVSVNATAGFSIVTYTGNGGSNATIGHGLGVKPNMIIVKNRDAFGSWPVYHSSLIDYTYILRLDTTDNANTSNTSFGATPTSTLFTVNQSVGTNNTNISGNKYVAYCWAEIAGFSKFGSYTGNGSSDGTFVYLGFRPKYIMIKASSTTGNWNLVDSTRNPSNVVGELLYADASDAGATYTLVDFLSNGFKLRNSGGNINNSGVTFVYAAFAENPFRNSLAR